MNNKSPFYITTTLPYVNAEPHIGFAVEIIRADIIARAKEKAGFDVFFNTGTDEHGLKIYRKALEAGLTPQAYLDPFALKFRELKGPLGLLSDMHFIRTTDEKHVYAAKEFWKIAFRNGFIYKKHYKIKYCVGCELEKTESELVEGKCPIHPNQALELIEEENYFFKFSAFAGKLLDLYASRPDFVIPAVRQNEIRAFVARGLEDFSISRLKEKMPWGVAVPGDEAHVMYVWFDALVNYVSTLGWPSDLDTFNHYWVKSGGVVQYCGKDNLRQQSAMWQAMLMAVNLPPSKQIVIDGFITSGGVKMSKSLGNVVDPIALVNEYGTDALRYYVARELSPFEDSDFTIEKFKESYNANLANGVGNLFSRVMKMATANEIKIGNVPDIKSYPEKSEYDKAFAEYDLKRAADIVWNVVQKLDQSIQNDQPFKVIKTDKARGVELIQALLVQLSFITELLLPLLPVTAEKMKAHISAGTMPEAPLFPRKE